jgi:hypothetical protein
MIRIPERLLYSLKRAASALGLFFLFFAFYAPPRLGGTGQVGWISRADRYQWLYDLASVLDNISIMAYGTDNIGRLDSMNDMERMFFVEAEIG